MANTNVKRVKTSDLELKDRLVAIRRVTKVTKGGRHFSFAAIVVVGDENGVVGYGLGKANEVTTAISKGIEDAKKNLVKVPVLNKTIPHEQEAKFGGARVFMKPAAPGTGVKAGGAMRAVFESVGIQNVLAKSKGSSNPHNLVKATIAALAEMRDAYTVAYPDKEQERCDQEADCQSSVSRYPQDAPDCRGGAQSGYQRYAGKGSSSCYCRGN